MEYLRMINKWRWDKNPDKKCKDGWEKKSMVKSCSTSIDIWRVMVKDQCQSAYVIMLRFPREVPVVKVIQVFYVHIIRIKEFGRMINTRSMG